VQPQQLGKAGQVGHLDQVEAVMLAREDPADMAVDEALVPRRVDVELGVRMQVVVPVLGGPPENALLRAGLRQEAEHELKQAAGRIGAVREVAVIAGADGEDAQPVERDAKHHGLPGDARPDRAEAGKVRQDEGNGGRIDDIVRLAVRLHLGGHQARFSFVDSAASL
jgi:hypothetical protein